MKKKTICLLLCAAMLTNFLGCAPEEEAELNTVGALEETLEPTVLATVPSDGNPEDVTCKGSYTSEENAKEIAAQMDGAELTNEELSAWYWAAVARYQQEQHENAPDFNMPLDVQPCTEDDSVANWQQYFLRQALSAWHSSQALILQSQQDEIPTEEAYMPNPDTHARCMTGMPVTSILYGYQKTYVPNSMHRAFLDGVPEMLAKIAREQGYTDTGEMAKAAFGSSGDALVQAVRVYNYGYTYLTFLNYETEISQEEAENWYTLHQDRYEKLGITRDSGICVDIRHVLLVPEGKKLQDCEAEAQKLLNTWKKYTTQTEAGFSEIAYRNSQDSGTSASGGGYSCVLRGQLPEQLDAWCFDASRKSGDTVILTTEQGVHILYFSGSMPLWQVQAEEDWMAEHYLQQIRNARERFPMEVDYSAICLAPANGELSFGNFLYPDIAHERFPEVPVYLQQDYPQTWYGNHKITSHGCGITTFSMLTTYMSDEEWTPPEMCDRFGNYSFDNGTDGMLYINEPSSFGYFFKERVYEYRDAWKALEEGYIVVSIQQKGYWTSGGHYILLERINEDGLVQVRDSNIANYFKLPKHKTDGHEWKNVVASTTGFWVFEPKITKTVACARCGAPDTATGMLLKENYRCEKCTVAVARRNAYLSAFGN